MPPDIIISLLQEARDRVEKTKDAVKLAIELTADAEKDNDGKVTKDSAAHQAKIERYQTELDIAFKEQQKASVKRRLFDQTGNLNKCLERAAKYGDIRNAPLELQNEIEALQGIVVGLKEELAELEQDS